MFFLLYTQHTHTLMDALPSGQHAAGIRDLRGARSRTSRQAVVPNLVQGVLPGGSSLVFSCFLNGTKMGKP
jgi:hypothetical protein